MGVSRIIVVIMIQCLRGDKMEFKDQLYKYRKEKGYSQEELAILCHVSRQAISKWENGTANPDMENLKILSKALSVNIDTLLGNEIEPQKEITKEIHYIYGWQKEYRSSIHIAGIPLVHINVGKGPRHDGKFHCAKGIIAIGNEAIGVVAIGALSAGLLSFGAISVGLITAGALALGAFVLGAVAIGYIAIGALAIGVYAYGALSIGFILAIGDHAYGEYAIGNQAFGNHMIQLPKNNGEMCMLTKDASKIIELLKAADAPKIFQFLIQMMRRC